MIAGFRSIVAPAVVLAALGATALAQYGHHGFGWGGTATPGDIAAGIGSYNFQTGLGVKAVALADAINTETEIRWNEYLFQSALIANTMQIDRMVGQTKARNEVRAKMRRNLRNEPTAGDIARGDALNAAVTELSNPKIDWRNLKSAGTKIPGAWVRLIPFNKASAAITVSVAELTRGGPPPALKVAAFDDDRKAMAEAAAQLREQNLEKGTFDPETVEKARALVLSVHAKVDDIYDRGSRERREADRYLKALLGLLRMLDTPAADVLFAGLEKRPEVTLADLLSFMKAYALRFGAAGTPEQRDIYSRLFPLLVRLRDEADAGDPYALQVEPSPESYERAEAVFSEMDYRDLDPPKAPAPAPNPPK